MNCFNVHNLLFKTFPSSTTSFFLSGSDASFPEQNCKLALSHMDTDVAFTKLCILSVAMTSKVLKTDRHRHPLMYKLLYLDIQSTKHVTSINVSYLIYYILWTFDGCQKLNRNASKRMIWSMENATYNWPNGSHARLATLYVSVE